jgi:hypothetical protein
MRRILIAIATSFILNNICAQQITDLKENTPLQDNGLEYGYSITNEASKEVKGEDFSRYEVNLYVVNRGSCIKLIPFTSSSTGLEDEVLIAEFSCKNATGKRFTSKSGKVNAKPWFTQVKVNDPSSSTKYKLVQAQAGYAIKSGQTISNKIIVIVPKGEKPVMAVRTVYLPEL